MHIGAAVEEGGVRFRLWAPDHAHVDVEVTEPDARVVAMDARDDGIHEVFVDGIGAGARYWFVVDGDRFPDPASRSQPDDVHGASAVVADAFEWSDPEWVGRVLAEYVVMEIHVGTFTDAGTLDSAIDRLDDLVAVGITAVELMPVAEFPGGRNWGYDGVFPYAVESSYGGPDALRRFVDAAHARGLSVVLDVVYNHLGPEGNVLGAFGPYFTDRYRTPWGDALNFDGPGSDGVRNFFIENARTWVRDFKIDALRLDAVHAIADPSAYPFVEELVDAVHDVAEVEGRHIWVIAESAANDARLITPKERGGIGADAQWNDDFHHALHVLLTGEHGEYYADFDGVEDLATAYREGFVYSGRYSPFRRRRHGRSAAGLAGERFVVFAQNHDHIGNRAIGDRLAASRPETDCKLAAAAVLCAPFVPLLFMGEEYAETNPFPYFISHTDEALVEAVRKGRREEFAEFAQVSEPPDPQAVATFESARLSWERRDGDAHQRVWQWHHDLLALRRERPALQLLDPTATAVQVFGAEQVIVVTREAADDVVTFVLGFGTTACVVDVELPVATWTVVLDSIGEPPAPFESTGAVRLDVPARSVLVLVAERGL
jgi:maltooligosyltrehalose trehalohydrolase